VIVVDASVAVKWVLDEKGADAALALRVEQIASPALWLIEAASALWSKARRGEISQAETLERLESLGHSPIETMPIERDLQSALRIANQLSHPIYDCLYLAAALRLDTHVVTADRRFALACAKRDDIKKRVKLLEYI
jgi:predicted nucleic acid-binding protein